jgi:hypothetical protein
MSGTRRRTTGRIGTTVTAPPATTIRFSAASGSGLFETAHALLGRLGVRTPRIYLLDRSRASLPADIALVEDVRGGTLEAQLELGLPGAGHAMARLGSALQVMHHHRSPIFGRPAADGGGVGIAPLAGAPEPGGGQRSCEHIVLDRALADLADAAGRVGRIAAARGPLEQAVRGLAAEVQPRIQYGLIHGELGPDHVCSSASTGTRS